MYLRHWLMENVYHPICRGQTGIIVLMKIPHTRPTVETKMVNVYTTRWTEPGLMIEVNQKSIWCLLSHRSAAPYSLAYSRPNNVIKIDRTASVPDTLIRKMLVIVGKKKDRSYLWKPAELWHLSPSPFYFYIFLFLSPTSRSTMVFFSPLPVFIWLRSVLLSSVLSWDTGRLW